MEYKRRLNMTKRVVLQNYKQTSILNGIGCILHLVSFAENSKKEFVEGAEFGANLVAYICGQIAKLRSLLLVSKRIVIERFLEKLKKCSSWHIKRLL